MIIVHDIFVCKPDNASKLAKLFKENMSTMPESKYVMTDMTGQFNRVIMVSEYANLTAYDQSWDAMKNPTKEMQESMERMKGWQEMYLTGSREIYRVTE